MASKRGSAAPTPQRPVGPFKVSKEQEDAIRAELLKECANKLQRMIAERDQHMLFANPVTDDIAPMYSSIITNPMDMKTMQSKIDKGEYKSLQDYKAHFDLMMQNCFTYNAPDTMVYQEGRRVQKYGNKTIVREFDRFDRELAKRLTRASKGLSARKKPKTSPQGRGRGKAARSPAPAVGPAILPPSDSPATTPGGVSGSAVTPSVASAKRKATPATGSKKKKKSGQSTPAGTPGEAGGRGRRKSKKAKEENPLPLILPSVERAAKRAAKNLKAKRKRMPLGYVTVDADGCVYHCLTGLERDYGARPTLRMPRSTFTPGPLPDRHQGNIGERMMASPEYGTCVYLFNSTSPLVVHPLPLPPTPFPGSIPLTNPGTRVYCASVFQFFSKRGRPPFALTGAQQPQNSEQQQQQQERERQQAEKQWQQQQQQQQQGAVKQLQLGKEAVTASSRDNAKASVAQQGGRTQPVGASMQETEGERKEAKPEKVQMEGKQKAKQQSQPPDHQSSEQAVPTTETAESSGNNNSSSSSSKAQHRAGSVKEEVEGEDAVLSVEACQGEKADVKQDRTEKKANEADQQQGAAKAATAEEGEEWNRGSETQEGGEAVTPGATKDKSSRDKEGDKEGDNAEKTATTKDTAEEARGAKQDEKQAAEENQPSSAQEQVKEAVDDHDHDDDDGDDDDGGSAWTDTSGKGAQRKDEGKSAEGQDARQQQQEQKQEGEEEKVQEPEAQEEEVVMAEEPASKKAKIILDEKEEGKKEEEDTSAEPPSVNLAEKFIFQLANHVSLGAVSGAPEPIQEKPTFTKEAVVRESVGVIESALQERVNFVAQGLRCLDDCLRARRSSVANHVIPPSQEEQQLAVELISQLQGLVGYSGSCRARASAGASGAASSASTPPPRRTASL